MTKTYYRQILGIIKKCKGCGKHWRPEVYSLASQNRNLCEVCRKEYHKKFYWNYLKPYLASLKPELKERLKEQKKKAWNNWVKKNPDRRREQALASYHRNKNKARNKRRRR